MYKQIFPILGDEKKLPFYIVGIGVECWQMPVDRPEGYDHPQFFVTRRGEGEITVNGETDRLSPGTVFYIPKKCPHSYRPLSESWIINWMCFSGRDAEPLLNEWDLNKFAIYNTGAEKLHSIMSKAYYTIISDKIYGNHYASASLYEILIEYRKIAENRQSEFTATSTAALADVLRYIEENYQNQIKLSELSDIAGITEQHLCRLFKKNFAMRPMEYLAKVRIKHAEEMLAFSSRPVSEIAAAVGFPDSSYFSVVFKKYAGVPPIEYRGRKY